MRTDLSRRRRAIHWLPPLLLLLGEGPSPEVVKDFPGPSWAVTRYRAIQDCAMANDVSRVLALEPDALHVFDPTGRETATIALLFTEVTGFEAPSDASFALVVGWEGEASRAMAVNAEGKLLFSNAFPADGAAYYERGAVAFSGAEFALLISGAGFEEGTSGEAPVADPLTIEVYSGSGEKLWESAPFEGGQALGLWVSDRVVVAGNRVWSWRDAPTAAAVSLPNDAEVYGLTRDDRIALGGYDESGDTAIHFYSPSGELTGTTRLAPLPTEAALATGLSSLFFAGSGYELIARDGSPAWMHVMAHPVQHRSMGISESGRFVAVSYLPSFLDRRAPETMAEFEETRFGTEFYVFDVWSGDPRWSFLASNPRLKWIRMSARGDDWVVCGENEIQAYHFHQGPVSYARGLLRNIVHIIAKPWRPEPGGTGDR